MKVTILREDEIRMCTGMDQESVNAVALGFTRLVEGNVSLPPVIRVDVDANQGEVDIKTAYIKGLDYFAIKIASGFFGNPSIGLPYGSGMMVLMSAKTGFLEAVLLDNGYLTDLRTGIAGAIVARHLAPSHIETAGVIGSGIQARYQVRGLRMMRDFRRLLVYGIDREGVEAGQEEVGGSIEAGARGVRQQRIPVARRGLEEQAVASPGGAIQAEGMLCDDRAVFLVGEARALPLRAEFLQHTGGPFLGCRVAFGRLDQDVELDFSIGTEIGEARLSVARAGGEP